MASETAFDILIATKISLRIFEQKIKPGDNAEMELDFGRNARGTYLHIAE